MPSDPEGSPGSRLGLDTGNRDERAEKSFKVRFCPLARRRVTDEREAFRRADQTRLDGVGFRPVGPSDQAIALQDHHVLDLARLKSIDGRVQYRANAFIA